MSPRILLFALTSVTAPAWAGTLSAEIPAKGIDAVHLIASDGEMHMTVSPDDAVHVKLDLQQEEHGLFGLFHWLSASTARDLAGVQLEKGVQKGELMLVLAYPSGETHSDVKEEWTVSVPARFAATVEMEAGMLSIKGLAGGIVTQLGAGDTQIIVPKGPVHAHQSAGRLAVFSDDTRPGVLHLKSSFGLAVLSFNGKYYGPPEEHGFLSHLHLFGNGVDQQGTGKDDIVLEQTAGLVSLRVGPLGDFKDYKGAFTDED